MTTPLHKNNFNNLMFTNMYKTAMYSGENYVIKLVKENVCKMLFTFFDTSCNSFTN